MRAETPCLSGLDHTLEFRREGYGFVHARAQAFHSDAFCGRLLGEKVVFLTGAAGAELFYDSKRFRRADALPLLVVMTLFGAGGVQQLDGELHQNRKAMFMKLMSRENLARYLRLLEEEWLRAAARWESERRATLLREAQIVLCKASCRWCGIEVSDHEAEQLSLELSALVEGFSTIGPSMWRARLARRRAERWAKHVIERVRTQQLAVPDGCAAGAFAEHRQPDGSLLPLKVAAVDLLNVVRPTTALSRFVAFMAVALRDHPSYLQQLRADDELVDAFVQEVRRFYPFTPVLGARARCSFEWQGVRFREGQLTILDVYGTLHDARVFARPHEFFPERFLDRQPTPFDFIPQGGGDFMTGHRCAGEWLSIETLKETLRFLTRRVRYELPAQDLSYRLNEIPPKPKSGVVLHKIERLAQPLPTFDAQEIRGGGNGLGRHA